jgi:O-antigen ligase
VVERVGLALLTEAAAGLLLLGVLAAVFLRREATGRRLTALHLAVLILVLDCALFPAGGTSTGVFVLPINNRTTGVLFLLMPFMLLVRWLSGRARLRWTAAGLGWLAFFCWLLVEFLAGRWHGNSGSAAVQEAKVIVMLGGAAMLAAGVEARDLVGREGIPRMVRWAAPIATIVTITSLAGVKSNSSFGLFHGVNTGQMGADAASVFASLGMLGLAVALAAPDHHRRGLISAGVLLIAPVFTGQRASLLGLVAGLGLIAVLPVFSRRHRVLRLLPKEKVAIGLTVLAVAGGLSLAAATGHGYNLKSSQVATSFTSAGKADSAKSRVNQWKVSGELIAQKPWVGYGLGKQYLHVEQIEGEPLFYVHNDLTHDIFLDVLLRSGIVGLFFLLVALLTSGWAGLRAAYRHVSPRIGALGLVATAILVEMATRGAVESIFEKERLAVLLGLAVGIACSAGRSTRTKAPTSSLVSAPLVVPPEWLPEDEAAGSRPLVHSGLVPQKNT